MPTTSAGARLVRRAAAHSPGLIARICVTSVGTIAESAVARTPVMSVKTTIATASH